MSKQSYTIKLKQKDSMKEIQKEIELLIQELKELPDYPWSLKGSKIGTFVTDKHGKEVVKINRDAPNYLVLANFLAYAPVRFEKLIEEIRQKE